MASVVEDKMERAIYLTPFSSRSLDDVVGELFTCAMKYARNKGLLSIIVALMSIANM